MEELMGTKLLWDQGKQERCERQVGEEEKARTKEQSLAATNKQLDETMTNKQLWGAEEDSGWYASSDKIISRSRNNKYIFVPFYEIGNPPIIYFSKILSGFISKISTFSLTRHHSLKRFQFISYTFFFREFFHHQSLHHLCLCSRTSSWPISVHI